MKRVVYTVILIMLFVQYTVAQTIMYVTPAGSGAAQGTGWDNALPGDSLQYAINLLAAKGGGQVWVAAGKYLPTQDSAKNSNPSDERTKTFTLRSGVQLYGGFAGTESSINERERKDLNDDTLVSGWEFVNVTQLSGELQGDDQDTNNVYHVVFQKELSISDVFIDGFSISDGYAALNTARGSNSKQQNHGGGAYLFGSEMKNCILTKNHADYGGGGVYVHFTTIDSSFITDNTSGYEEQSCLGAGVLMNEQGTVRNCLITQNKGLWGAAVFMNAGGLLVSSKVTNNIAAAYYSSAATSVTAHRGGSILNSLIANNVGFVSVLKGSIVSSTIINNTSAREQPYLKTLDQSDMVNSIFADTIIQSASKITYSVISKKVDDTVTNMVVDSVKKLFLGLHYEATLKTPGFNVGSPDISNLNLPEYDLAGKPRVSYERIDRGAFEYMSRRYVTESGGIEPFDGSSWEHAYPKDSLLSAINAGYGDVWVAAGNYSVSGVDLKEGVRVYGGFNGDEKKITDRKRSDIDNSGKIDAWEFSNATLFTTTTYESVLSCSQQAVVDGISFIGNTKGSAVSFSKGSVLNCTFARNTSSSSCVWLRDTAEIRNCLIEKNTASSSGGGITLSGKSRAYSCVIRDNKTTRTNESHGGGVVLEGTALLAESVISNNFNNGRYDMNGGGVYANGGIIRNCVITNNTTSGVGTRGGGVFVNDNSNTQIINSTICNNLSEGESAQGNDLAIAVRAQVVNTIVGSSLFVRGLSTSNRMKYCALPVMVKDYGIDSIFVYNGTADLYNQFIAPTAFAGVAKTVADSAALKSADWHLKNSSWFINKGLSDNSVAKLPELDADQTARVKYGQIDLGAYEKQITKPNNTILSLTKTERMGTSYSASFAWPKDSTDRYLLFMKEGTSGRVQPIDGETYTADAVFGKGSNCNGWYCAYNGTELSATVNGLLQGTDYKAMLVTQNGLRVTVYNADLNKNIVEFTTKRKQTISFKLPDTLYAGNSYIINAVSTSGLDVEVRTDNKEYVTVGGNKIWVNKADNYTKTIYFVAKQLGNSQYEAADSVVQRVMISKSRQKINFPSIAAKRYGEGAFTPIATASSGLGVTFRSSDPRIAMVYNNQIYINKPGTVTITASQAGNSLYFATDSIEQKLEINAADQYISFPMLSDKVFGDADFIPAATASSQLPVTLRTMDTSIIKIIDNQIHIVGVGTASIFASQYGNEYYAYADSIERFLTVKKAKQVISFAPIANKTFNDEAFTPNVSITSNQPITLTSNNTKVAKIVNNTIVIVGAGTVTITASQSDSTLYEAAVPVSQSFTVRKAQQFIIAENQLTLEYGSRPFKLQASSSSGKSLSFLINGTVLGAKDDSITVNSAGVATINITLNGDANYLAAAPKTIFVTVLPKIQTIALQKFEQAVVFADTVLDPQTNSSEQLPVSLTSSDMSVAQIVNDTLIKIVGVGSCMITPVQSGTVSVSSAIGQAQKLVVVPAAQQIKDLPAALQTKVGAEPTVLHATALQNCRVSYELLSGTSIELVENKIYALEPGVSRVVARVSGYKNYRDTTDTCVVVVSALNNLRMPTYTITRDTVINLQQLVMTADTFDFRVVNPSTQITAAITDSFASITIDPTQKSWMGVDTIWFVAKNRSVTADSLLLAIKVRRRPLVEQIGVVTVDSTNGKHCIVAWERSQNAGIVGYIMYRGGTTAKWDSIGYVAASKPGIFVDSAAQVNVAKQAYQYKMVTVYPGNVRSEASAVHTTMHLQTGRNLENIPQLLWTPYKGADVSMYIIYREDPITHKLDSIGSSILTSFTDVDAPAQTSRYRVAIRFANQINPDRLKADTGPFSQSLSNMSEASLVDLATNDAAVDVAAYPNPASDILSIEAVDVIETVEFVSASGKVVKQLKNVSARTLDVSVKDLTAGLYSVLVTTAKGTEIVKVQCAN